MKKPSRDQARRALTQLLLVFIWVSLGYAWGQGTQKKGFSAPLRGAVKTGGGSRQVGVYYLHSTFRCETCNTIERMARELVHSRYQKELNAGSLFWKEVDFMERTDLAERFGVVASCVVVALWEENQVTSFLRLDEVWTRMKNQEAFDRYVGQAIEGFLLQRAAP